MFHIQKQQLLIEALRFLLSTYIVHIQSLLFNITLLYPLLYPLRVSSFVCAYVCVNIYMYVCLLIMKECKCMTIVDYIIRSFRFGPFSAE